MRTSTLFRLSFIVALLFPAVLSAQTTRLVVVSTAGEPFFLTVDGQAQGDVAAVRFVVDPVARTTPELVLRFLDPAVPVLQQTCWLQAGAEHEVRVTTDRRGQRVLRMAGLDKAPSAGQRTVPALAAGMRSGKGVVRGAELHTEHRPVALSSGPVPSAEGRERRGCAGEALSAADLDLLAGRLAEAATDDERLAAYKAGRGAHCLTSAQVLTLLQRFKYDDRKLELAKFAFDHTSDTDNYERVSAAFAFKRTAEELDAYIRSR